MQKPEMFISIVYKDVPELSCHRFKNEPMSELDSSTEKTLLVNPDCPIRIMLEYIRKKCRLGIFTRFDLCDESGALKGLFNLPTYAQAINLFEHKKTYFIIVLKTEADKHVSVLPQVNRDSKRYDELINRVKQCLAGNTSPNTVASSPAPEVKQSAASRTAGKVKKLPETKPSRL